MNKVNEIEFFPTISAPFEIVDVKAEYGRALAALFAVVAFAAFVWVATL